MESILPSAANWYCSRIVDCNQQGIAVIGAKNSLDVWNLKALPARHIANFTAHQDRIVGVSLCMSDHTCYSADDLPRCCTAGEDGIVRMWNLNSKDVIKEHSHHKVCVMHFLTVFAQA
jgi:WD40 repeat protein